MQAALWKVGMVGGLRVHRPDGSPVIFKTRKSGGILAILVLRRGNAILRSELSEIFWSHLPPAKRLTNLRQGLSHLRESLDPNLILATRETCRIDIDQVECPDIDYVATHEFAGDLLLPEMREPWFEGLRRVKGATNLGPALEEWKQEKDAAQSLLSVLDWSAEFRPRATLEIARAAPELAQSAEPRRLIAALDAGLAAVRPNDPLVGWGICQKAIAGGMIGRLELASRQLRTAKEHAISHGDRELLVESSFYLAGFQIVQGKCQEAISCLKEVATRCPNLANQALIRLSHGLGLALIHAGSVRQGMAELRKACELCDDRTPPFERAYLIANLAWFESTCGDPRRAMSLIETLRTTGGARAWRIELTSLLAEAMVAFAAGESDRTRRIVEQILATCRRFQSVGFAVYANEILALDAFRSNDGAEAEFRLAASQEDRKTTGCKYTVWDQYRLKSIAHLIKS